MAELKARISEHLLKQRNLSPSTLKTYTSLLSSLYKKLNGEGGMDFFQEQERILEHVKSLPSPQTRKTVLSALFVLTGIQEYREGMSDDIRLVNSQYREQKTSEKRAPTLITFERVQEIHEELRRLMKRNPTQNNIVNYLISCVCSGVYGEALPPRRLEYAMMKIRKFNPETDNYADKGVFVFNQYKTVRKHGKQTIPIPKDLNALILRWKKLNPTDYLLLNDRGEPFSTSALGKRIKELFDGNSQDVLRSIFLSHYYRDVPHLERMEALAAKMGHTVGSAMSFYVKKD